MKNDNNTVVQLKQQLCHDEKWYQFNDDVVVQLKR